MSQRNASVLIGSVLHLDSSIQHAIEASLEGASIDIHDIVYKSYQPLQASARGAVCDHKLMEDDQLTTKDQGDSECKKDSDCKDNFGTEVSIGLIYSELN